MKYLIFCLKNKLIIDNLINLISNNYNIQLELLNKNDFIKSNNCYIYINQQIINKILTLKIEFNEIEQVLYFESSPEYIPYFNIIQINLEDNFKIKYDTLLNYFFPTYFINNEKSEDNYYLIQFNMIDYIQSIDSEDLNNKLITLKNKNNIISNFDVLHFKPVYVNLNIIGVLIGKNKIFNNFINNIKQSINIINDNFYRIDGDEEHEDFESRTLIILDENVNNFLNSDDGKKLINSFKQEIKTYITQKRKITNYIEKYFFRHSIIKVNNRHINDINVIFIPISDIVREYYSTEGLVITDNWDWDYINERLSRGCCDYEGVFVIDVNTHIKSEYIVQIIE